MKIRKKERKEIQIKRGKFFVLEFDFDLSFFEKKNENCFDSIRRKRHYSLSFTYFILLY